MLTLYSFPLYFSFLQFSYKEKKAYLRPLVYLLTSFYLFSISLFGKRNEATLDPFWLTILTKTTAGGGAYQHGAELDTLSSMRGGEGEGRVQTDKTIEINVASDSGQPACGEG